MSGTGRRRGALLLKTTVRLLIGAGLVALLLWRADVSAVLDAIRGADLTEVILAIIAITVGVLFSGLRWQAFLGELDLPARASAAIRLTFVGSFFNAFLPTGFGGDAYKAFRLRGEPRALHRAVASVLLDRWAGIVGMAILAVIGSAAQLVGDDRSEPVVVAAVLAIAILMSSLAVLVLGPRLLARVREPESTSGHRSHLTMLARAIVLTGRHPRAATAGLLLGVVSAGFVLLGHVFLAAALDLDVPIGGLAGIVLIAALITVIPITVNGLGLREAAYVWALGAYGVGHDEALAFGLLALGAILASSVVGGLLYLIGGAEVAPRPRDEPA